MQLLISIYLVVQIAKIVNLEKRIKALEDDKAALAKQRDLIAKEFEGKCPSFMNIVNLLITAAY